MSSPAPIAIFDSGVGGLTVFSKLKKLLPAEDYVYFGDTAHMPYGDKSEAELTGFVEGILSFFGRLGAKAAVMACNTTSAVVYERVKDKYPFRIFPVIQSVAEILARLPVARIGVLATQATVASGAYSREIRRFSPNMEVVEAACPEWVRLVEEGRSDEGLVRARLEEVLARKVERIVLGCTHYPYLLPVLEKFAPREMFVDPAEAFAKFISENIVKNTGLGSEKIYVSAAPEAFRTAGQMFYPEMGAVENISLSFPRKRESR